MKRVIPWLLWGSLFVIVFGIVAEATYIIQFHEAHCTQTTRRAPQ